MHLATNKVAPRVSVVLANWNGADLTIPCIESLLKCDYSNVQIIVVDDASTDSSCDRISERFPRVELIRQPTNQGVSAARNRGIERAFESSCDYVLFLDNDTVVEPSLIRLLVAGAQAHGNSVAVGPKIYYLRDPNRLWFACGRLSLWTGIYANSARNEIDAGQYDQETRMDVGSSCCLLVPAAILRAVGGFDPRFTWNEDVDWSLRCRRSGYGIVYWPKARMWHLVNGSSSKQRAASIRYFLTRNQFWAFRKVASRPQMIVMTLLYPVRAFVRMVKMILQWRWDCVVAECRGAKDGLCAPIEKVCGGKGEVK